MTEKTKGALYLTYLDRLLAGETNIKPIEDEEVAGLIRLSHTVIAADFSRKSAIRESLRKQLRLSPVDESVQAVGVTHGNIEEELTEADLDLVTAAGQGSGSIPLSRESERMKKI